MSKRNFSITRKEGEMYDVRVVDSYGKKYQNYFECASKANDWVYYIWEKEDWFNSQNSQELSSSIAGITFNLVNILLCNSTFALQE